MNRVLIRHKENIILYEIATRDQLNNADDLQSLITTKLTNKVASDKSNFKTINDLIADYYFNQDLIVSRFWCAEELISEGRYILVKYPENVNSIQKINLYPADDMVQLIDSITKILDGKYLLEGTIEQIINDVNSKLLAISMRSDLINDIKKYLTSYGIEMEYLTYKQL